MKTVIYLVRHGQSMANLLNKFAGHSDFPLSEKGVKQAELTANYFTKINVDAVYSSDLIRAYNTAKAIADKKGLTVIKNVNLREIHCGVWESADYDDITNKYDKEFSVWQNDIWNFQITGGESTKSLFERINNEIINISEKHKGQAVILGTHAMAIRTFCGQFIAKDISLLQTVPWASNASVTTLEYENGKFNLITYGFDGHLGDFSTSFNPTKT